MEQRDYLLRQFEQLGIVLARLLGFKNSGKLDDGLEVVDQTLNELLDIDSEYLNCLTEEYILKELTEVKQFNLDQIKILAQLLNEEADFYYMKNEAVNYKTRYKKVLILLRFIDQTEKVFSLQRNDMIELINKRLNE